MLNALQARGIVAGEKATREMTARLAGQIAAEWPDLRVEAMPDGVTIEGRGLTRRMIDDAALRHPVELLR